MVLESGLISGLACDLPHHYLHVIPLLQPSSTRILSLTIIISTHYFIHTQCHIHLLSHPLIITSTHYHIHPFITYRLLRHPPSTIHLFSFNPLIVQLPNIHPYLTTHHPPTPIHTHLHPHPHPPTSIHPHPHPHSSTHLDELPDLCFDGGCLAR